MNKFIRLLLIEAIIYLPFNCLYAARLWTTGENRIIDVTQYNYTNVLTNETSIVRTGGISYGQGTLVSGQRTGNLFGTAALSVPTFLRFYLYINTTTNVLTSIASINATSPYGARATVRLSTDTKLGIFSGATQIGSYSSALNTGQWYRVEVEADRNTGTDDVLGLYIDGVYVASTTTTNLSSTFGAFGLGSNLAAETATSGAWYFDDIAFNDNSGSAQTSFPGAGSVEIMYPNATGDFAEGSSGTGGSGWNDIDDNPSDGDTSYWILADPSTSSTDPDRLDVNMESTSDAGITSGSTINLVHVNSIIRNDNSASSQCTLRIKSQASGTIAEGTTISITSGTWVINDDSVGSNYHRLTSYTDPQAGGSWTTSLLDTMQIGARSPDATPDLFITALWAIIDYIPAVGGSSDTTNYDPIIVTDE